MLINAGKHRNSCEGVKCIIMHLCTVVLSLIPTRGYPRGVNQEGLTTVVAKEGRQSLGPMG